VIIFQFYDTALTYEYSDISMVIEEQSIVMVISNGSSTNQFEKIYLLPGYIFPRKKTHTEEKYGCDGLQWGQKKGLRIKVVGGDPVQQT